MLILIYLISTLYLLIIISLIFGFFKIKTYKPTQNIPTKGFSIIIPFRNEEDNLPELLESLLKIDYPQNLFEILFINDESEDESVKIIEARLKNVNDINYTIINNQRKSNSPKKDAIETAINQSNYDWIITTDADCEVPKSWLKNFDAFIKEKQPKMICAPVTLKTENNFLNTFQLLDFISLIGSTIGGFGINKPFLCNGANLCYEKDSFITVNGYDGNNTISSGDDIFLLEKFQNKFKNSVKFLKNETSIVETKSEREIKNLVNQRIRWASKTKYYDNTFAKIVGITIFLMNLLCVGLIISSFFNHQLWKLFGMIFLMKICLDFIIIYSTLKFTNQSKKIIFYPVIAFLHPFFTIFVAFLAFFRKNQKWKEREISV